jgi:hypothetical protein
VLPLPITAKGLEVIARKRAEVVESLGGMQLRQLALSDPGKALKPTRRIPLEQMPRHRGSGRTGSPAQDITDTVIWQALQDGRGKIQP